MGVLFVVLLKPLLVQAGFLSSIFGGAEVYADTNPGEASNSKDNSQTIALLAANVLPAPIVAKKTKPEEDPIDQTAEVNIVSDNALLPATGPADVSGGADFLDSSSPDQISIYVVRKGDSISAVASMFGVSVDTILAANDMKKGEKLKEGDVLFILPISGLEHTVTKGETLASIAKLYKADMADIILYNGLSEKASLAIGDKLMIPGGEMADEGGDKPAPNLSSAVARDQNYYATHPIRSVAGYFINPVPTGRKTQGLHGPGKRGIDIGAPKGTPIYASASGTVLAAKSGWDGGYGNMVIIQHPNGTKTLYAHMSQLGTATGASVNQGQLIGYVGSTGHSTGPHLHFEVFNAKNPGADWSWKK
jgi:murein DD-endopeptidase MepM/ murein hydrolase activator NlpD